MPHRLHSVLHTATVMLDLPLDTRQLEALALHLTPVVRAWCAEAIDTAAADSPVPYAVATTTVDTEVGVETTEYAGCVSRISVDVDHDSPAAVLAEQLRRHHDVVVTDVPSAVYLGLSIRPKTVAAWKWWLKKLSIAPSAVTVQGTDAYASSEVDGVLVALCGEDTGTLLSADVHTRQGLDVDLDSPAGTVAAKARRQPDVTSIEIRDAHTLTVTVRATSLLEWQWWLAQLSVAPGTVQFEGTTAIATGSKDDAVVHLRGDDCAAFYEDQAAARLVGLIAGGTQ
ncbi:hypothetical protein [Streptomyces sp. NBC_00582]|uniref:hypothetical protein n=1 Tax=Streptomyces sp. NBC_00582 TaxID=2975783 RepID=UPI002E81A7C1|nr:hypothetical protein [Streptomyces sp. NBC_00582]WUB64476.1 hypothetical protein OG852_30810 [Streptomyces sp. NBC_00582]